MLSKYLLTTVSIVLLLCLHVQSQGYPPTPFLIQAKSDSITIGWPAVTCYGWHPQSCGAFEIRYYYISEQINHECDGTLYDVPCRINIKNYHVISDIDPGSTNYTVHGLQPSTEYTFSIRIHSFNSSYESRYSSEVTFSTLPPSPDPPREVSAKLVGPLLVEVRWREPAVGDENITHYTIYATPFEPTIAPPVLKAFPGFARAGNITLLNHSFTYHLQVSASIVIGEAFNQTIFSEGELSVITSNSTIFVPNPEAPSAGDKSTRVEEIIATTVTMGVVIITLLVAILTVFVLIMKRKPKPRERFGQNKSGKHNEYTSAYPESCNEVKQKAESDINHN